MSSSSRDGPPRSRLRRALGRPVTEAREAGETDERLFAEETALAALVISIAAINVWNRLNVSTRQLAGSVQAWG